MQPTTFMIAAVLSLQFSFLFNGNNDTLSNAKDESISFNTNTIKPVKPTEAPFEKSTVTSTFISGNTNLAPVTPVEADFSDIVPEKNIDLTILAPITPANANFNDDFGHQPVDFSVLAPLTPSEADFDSMSQGFQESETN